MNTLAYKGSHLRLFHPHGHSGVKSDTVNHKAGIRAEEGVQVCGRTQTSFGRTQTPEGAHWPTIRSPFFEELIDIADILYLADMRLVLEHFFNFTPGFKKNTEICVNVSLPPSPGAAGICMIMGWEMERWPAH